MLKSFLSSHFYLTMKKLISAVISFLFAFTLLPLSAQAATNDYGRLYQQFLDNIQNPTSPVETPDAASVKTSKYSLSGKVSRGENGSYYIKTDEKPSRTLRVYGQVLAKEIIKSVLVEKVQLIGEKAFFKGKEVGISVREVIYLSQPAPKAQKTPTAPQLPALTVFRGTIEISSDGNPFLVLTENKKRITRRLLNEMDWKKAFQKAYKGEVEVEGYLNEKGAIRFTDIW